MTNRFLKKVSSVFHRSDSRRMFRAGLFLCLIVFLTSNLLPTHAQDDGERIAELESKVQEFFDHDAWLSNISTDAVDMYFLWPGIDGLLTLYEATGNTEYVGYALEYCQRYQSLGEDMNGDGYLDWYSSWIEDYSHTHVEWRAGAGVARTVALILTDPGLSAFTDGALELQGFLEKHIWKKWTGGYSNVGNSTNVTHFIGRLGLIALSLYQITGEEQFLAYILTKGNQLKDALILNDQGAYWWGVYTDGGGAVDVSHGGDTVNFMVEAFRLGLVFEAEDILHLIKTVRVNLWNGSTSGPDFRSYVDGTGDFGDVGFNQGGWIKLAQFDPELEDIYVKWLETRGASSYLDVHFYGNLARSIHYSPFPPEEDFDMGDGGRTLELHIAIAIILERNTDPLLEGRMEMDGNGSVDVLDLQRIVNEYMDS